MCITGNNTETGRQGQKTAHIKDTQHKHNQHHNTRHNATQHNATQHNDIQKKGLTCDTH